MEPTACVVFSAEEGNSMKQEQDLSLEWECLGLFYKLRLGLKHLKILESFPEDTTGRFVSSPHSGCEHAI